MELSAHIQSRQEEEGEEEEGDEEEARVKI